MPCAGLRSRPITAWSQSTGSSHGVLNPSPSPVQSSNSEILAPAFPSSSGAHVRPSEAQISAHVIGASDRLPQVTLSEG